MLVLYPSSCLTLCVTAPSDLTDAIGSYVMGCLHADASDVRARTYLP